MASRPTRVLYIDDDPGLARLIQKNLERRGYVVERADKASSGLERIRAGGIDVVGLDHYLDTGTGLDVLAELAKIEHAPPVVYVTGSAETAIAVAALKAGAFDYVTKSVSEDFPELLASAIDQAVERARLMRAKERVEGELREAKERAELLLSEVNHRVANSLAIVGALIRMQANTLTEPAAKNALIETQARISAIAGVHKRLYTSDDVRFVDIGEYLTTLVKELDMSLASSARLRIRMDAVRVPTDMAISIGIMTAELVTNALKYAYSEGVKGEVRVFLDAVPDGAVLVVEDDGVGWDGTGQSAKGTGLGTRLVNSMAANLGATLTYELQHPGTRAKVTMGF
ncbi:histidine kinase dimerization/phosphoacceptor domain -containing protein [Rhizobium sp. EC-SD404]|uniref:histidine kinase dimerization/phosphoacceptor domain -containing protein n=1 Tax=Rhizobium sp. EC-SD404 TaxID=2038389 RepID=UPI00125F0BAD|nr:histidine kinase dimerization/phosphoacceptor domain -containing protein [Rhizobium sp. EC-SD404]